ncbi:clumping factor B-like [Pararge aegeria]|uniref:clumping factor B-like n=1 Tax=Pararge aegeria TaxID=116150 RepID=UPI0019CFFBCE|nr:clumping factor B-like [Pararge aegeria]
MAGNFHNYLKDEDEDDGKNHNIFRIMREIDEQEENSQYNSYSESDDDTSSDSDRSYQSRLLYYLTPVRCSHPINGKIHVVSSFSFGRDNIRINESDESEEYQTDDDVGEEQAAIFQNLNDANNGDNVTDESDAYENDTDENAIDENAIDENAIDENAIDDNATNEDATGDKASDDNTNDDNATDYNAIDYNAIDYKANNDNAINDNATDYNSTGENEPQQSTSQKNKDVKERNQAQPALDAQNQSTSDFNKEHDQATKTNEQSALNQPKNTTDEQNQQPQRSDDDSDDYEENMSIFAKELEELFLHAIRLEEYKMLKHSLLVEKMFNKKKKQMRRFDLEETDTSSDSEEDEQLKEYEKYFQDFEPQE